MSSFPVSALRSVDFCSTDVARQEAFYTQVWGLEVAERRAGSAYLRASGDDHHVLALHPGERNALRAVTFRCSSADALAALPARAEAAGCRIVDLPAASDRPGGGTMMAIRSREGAILRFVHGDERRTPDLEATDRPVRLAHVNINAIDVDATARFYEDALGFMLIDRSRPMAFLRCNADHHAVVVAEAPVNGLNHVAFLMPGLDAVMRGSGRMIDNGYPIGWGVGRHGPGDNVFAYFVDPLGFVIEYTAEVLQVDDSYRPRGPSEWVWPPGRTDQWGIAPPKSAACKEAQIAIPFAQTPGP